MLIDKYKQTTSLPSIMTFIFNKQMEVMQVINPDGAILDFFKELPPTGTLALDFGKFIKDEYQKEIKQLAEILKKAQHTHTNVQNTYTLVDAENKLWNLTFSCYFQADGTLVMYAIKENLKLEIINHLNTGITVRRYEVNQPPHYTFVNDKCQNIYGTDHIEDSPYWNEEKENFYDEQVSQTNNEVTFELEYVDECGNEVCQYVNKQLVRETANSYSVVTTYRDISCRKTMENAMRKHINQLSFILNHTHTTLFTFHPKNDEFIVFSYMNPQNAQHIYRYNEIEQLIHPNDRLKYKQCIDNLLNNVSENEQVDVRTLNNETKVYKYHTFFMMRSVDDNGEPIVAGLLRNISRYKEAEDTNVWLSSLNEMLFNNLPQGIEIYDNKGQLVAVNDKDCENFGYITRDQSYGLSLWNMRYLSEKDKEKLHNGQPCQAVIAYNFEEKTQKDYFPSTRKGTGHFIIHVKPFINAHKKCEGYILASEDITEIVQSRNKQMEANEQLGLALKAGKVSAWEMDVKTKQFCSIKGETMVGHNMTFEDMRAILHPEDRAKFITLLYSLIMEENDTVSMVYRIIMPDNSCQHYETIMKAIHTNGHVTSIIGTEKNITETVLYQEQLRKESVKSQQILQQVIDNIPCALAIKNVSADFKYVMINKAFCKMAHKPNFQILEKKDFDIFDMVTHRRIMEYDMKALKADKTIRQEMDNIFVNDNTCHQWISAPLKLTSGETYLVHLAIDITNLKNKERELTIQKERAEQMAENESAFLANISHDIRTPLNAIVGFSEMLQYATEPAEREQFFKIISTNSELLLRLVNDVLDLSKLESGEFKFNMKEFDLSFVFNAMCETLISHCNKPSIKIRVHNPYKSCIVNFDQSRLLQIGNNFGTNAIKYTQEGCIDFAYELVKDGVCISVRDTGPGIPKDKQDNVFKRFCRLDSATQGTGLGLPICKIIAEKAGGEIGFESEQGKGSRFWVYIPCHVVSTKV